MSQSPKVQICGWCLGFGLAVVTVAGKEQRVQRCDTCKLYESDFAAHVAWAEMFHTIRNYEEWRETTQRSMEIQSFIELV